MERRLKERLIGAAVLVMMAVILIPMILDDTADSDISITESNIPSRPEDDFNSRIVPVKESDMTPIPVESVSETITEPVEEILEAATPPVVEEMPVVEEDRKTAPAQIKEKTASNKQMGVTAWVVQLGSFSSEENAKGLNEKLRLAGYPAFVEPLKRQSGIAYRVRVGPEILRSDAEALQQKLKKSMQIDGIVIRYP
jgi:DedD protein